MIYDRTEADIFAAKELRSEIQKGTIYIDELTERQEEIMERGTFGKSTILRIESACMQALYLIQDTDGYNVGFIPVQESVGSWESGKIFYLYDMQKIIDSVAELRRAFMVYPNTPEVPEPIYHYSAINAIEKILFDLIEIAEYLKDHYIECGTVECGEV